MSIEIFLVAMVHACIHARLDGVTGSAMQQASTRRDSPREGPANELLCFQVAEKSACRGELQVREVGGQTGPCSSGTTYLGRGGSTRSRWVKGGKRLLGPRERVSGDGRQLTRIVMPGPSDRPLFLPPRAALCASPLYVQRMPSDGKTRQAEQSRKNPSCGLGASDPSAKNTCED